MTYFGVVGAHSHELEFVTKPRQRSGITVACQDTRTFMRKTLRGLAIVALLAMSVGTGMAQQAPGTPGVIVGGSSTVSVGGLPAARESDPTPDGHVIQEGSPNVVINGRPAATIGDRTTCGGVVVRGANNVFINGKPAARVGDATSGCAAQ